MDGITIRRRHPTVSEFRDIRGAAGWWVPDEAIVQRALQGGLFSFCAERDGQTVGMARVIGDGAISYHIQDLIVLPEYQRKGIGTVLMDAVMEGIDKQAPAGARITLFAAPGLEPFYSRYGFVERPHGKLGPGMVCVKKQGNETEDSEQSRPAHGEDAAADAQRSL